MLYLLLVGWLCCQIFTLVESNGDMGQGMWHVNYVEKCDEVTHKFIFEVSKKKINRTHDGFNAKITLEEAFDDRFGVRCEICKLVDGGCKSFQVLTDDSFINFVNKYAKSNVRSCLEKAGVDPPEFPLAVGNYEVNDYIWDYTELPKNGPFGKFAATCYMIESTAEVGCIKVYLDFLEDSEDVDDDEK